MEILEKYFDTAFTAPDGIKKLRELILTLAMQGKLVEQDPDDQPARELLEEIEAEKKRLVKAGKIKKPKPLPEIKADEVPYALPDGWEWVRLGEVSHDWGQKIPDSLFTYIDVTSIDNSKGIIGDKFQILTPEEAPSRARRIVAKGTVLYSTVRPYLQNIAIVNFEYEHKPIASTAFAVLHPFLTISNHFIYHFLHSPIFVKYVETTMKGVAYPAISNKDFFNGVIPFPPVLEQHRIVAKIDQLMARCDELEKLRTEQEQKRLAAHTSALRHLLDAQEQNSFTNAWKFLTTNFGELYTVKENVSELRKAILQLAVMGKLVGQDPNDQPASELLKEIETEKKRLVKEKKIKKPKELAEIKADEVPYVLPDGWEWVRCNDVFDVRDGTHDTPKYVDTGYPLVTSKNLYSGQLSFDNIKFISDIDHKKITERSKVDFGDILFAMIGSIGNPVIVDCDCDFSIKNLALFKFYISNVPSNKYLHCYLKLAQFSIRAKSSGAVQSFVSLTFLRKYLFPLPPLAEQHRIITKVDQLMTLCDDLEHQIDTATNTQNKLLSAVMAQV